MPPVEKHCDGRFPMGRSTTWSTVRSTAWMVVVSSPAVRAERQQG